MARQYIQGTTETEKWESLEKLIRRIHLGELRHATVIIPHIPISVAVDEIPQDGVIYRKMFAVEGHISHVKIFCEDLDDKLETTPILSISIKESGKFQKTEMRTIKPPMKEYTQGFPIVEGLIEYGNLSLPLPSGCRMIISVFPTTGLKNLWLSAAYETDIRREAKEALLVDDLSEALEASMEALDAGEKTKREA